MPACGRAEGRTPAPRQHPRGGRGEPPRRRRPFRVDLAGPREVGQHPLRPELSRRRTSGSTPARMARSSSSAAPTSRISSTRRPRPRSRSIDLTPAREFLEPDWGRRSLAGWAHHKFGLAIDPESWAGLDRAEIIRQLQAKAREHYALKESELPVRIALTRFLAERSPQHHLPPRYDREGLAAWAVGTVPHGHRRR